MRHSRGSHGRLAVLHAGVLAVSQLEPGKLACDDAVRCVDERGDPRTVGVGELQLRAGVRALLAQDQPGPARPCGQVDQPGGLSLHQDCDVVGCGVVAGVVGAQ